MVKKFKGVAGRGLLNTKKAPMLVTLTSMGAELQSQNRVDVCYGNTFGLGA